MDMMTLLAAGLAFLAVAAAGLALVGGEQAQSKRAKAMGEGRRPQRASAFDMAMSKRKQANLDALKDLSERERQSRRSRLSVDGQLKQAALPLSEPAFWGISAVVGACLGAAALVMQAPLPVALAGAIIGGMGLPRWVLGFLIAGRQKKFLDQFADGIDVIVRGVKSGLPLNQCLQIVSNESAEPLKSEFKSLIDGVSMGVPLHQNLQRLYERMPLPEVNFFGIVLIIQQKTGGNLAEALGNLSGVLRSRKLLKEKIKALSAEARASAGIIGSLPFLVGGLVYLSRPDYIMVLFTDDLGKLILIVCGVLVAMGFFVMNRMVNFKY